MLAETAHKAGVITNEEFAVFQNAGYMGLYGGLDVDNIHTKKGLEVGQKILDYMGSTELIANLFRISQTEEKLRKDEIKIDELTHQDLGQMQMYVNYFERYERVAGENPTIGILLCKQSDEALVDLMLPEDANIYAKEYKLYLPDKKLLQKKLK